MKILTIIEIRSTKPEVVLKDQDGNVLEWRLGTALNIKDYKIGDKFKRPSRTVIERIGK